MNNIKNRIPYKAIASALVPLAAGSLPLQAKQAPSGKPNIIIILNDDQGYSDLSCFGAKDIDTPNIDRLADTGIKFTDFYVASSVSSASRAALITGCYPQRVGVRGVIFPTADEGLHPGYTTLAEIAKTAGYATAAVGKWHLGDAPEYLPTNQGFDSYFGIPYSNDMYPSRYIPYADDCVFREGYDLDRINTEFLNAENKRQPKSMRYKVPLVRDGKCIEFPCDQSTITERYADESIAFIKNAAEKGKPFFLYLANNMPHVPLYVSDKFKGSSRRGLYGDVIQEIDYNVGRIVSTLDELGIRENTLVIYLSDNGPWLSKGADGGVSYPLFEGKFTSFEGGFRVPAIFSWPGMLPEGVTCDEMAASIDVFPTMAFMLGVDISQDDIDGVNIFSLLQDPSSPSPRVDHYMVNKSSSMRSGQWKYHAAGMFYDVKKTARDEKGPALYNLKEDIGESHNLIKEYPEIAEEMANKLAAHKERLANKAAHK